MFNLRSFRIILMFVKRQINVMITEKLVKLKQKFGYKLINVVIIRGTQPYFSCWGGVYDYVNYGIIIYSGINQIDFIYFFFKVRLKSQFLYLFGFLFLLFIMKFVHNHLTVSSKKVFDILDS